MLQYIQEPDQMDAFASALSRIKIREKGRGEIMDEPMSEISKINPYKINQLDPILPEGFADRRI